MKKCWKINNSADSKQAEILLYGVISDESWYGDEVTPKAFRDELAALEGKDVLVRINSVGGDVFAAQAIYNTLKAYTGKVNAIIDGLAASAATIVMVAAENVVVPKNTMVMIHNPLTVLCGYYQSEELQKLSNTLDKVRDTIVNVYQDKTGDKCTEKQICELMDNETWLTGEEAIAYGFADSVVENSIDVAMNGNLVIVNGIQYNNLPNKAAFTKGFKGTIKNRMQNKGEEKDEMINNKEDLLKAYPDLCNVICAEAATAALATEQARITALDALDVAGNTTVNQIIAKAKVNGKTAEDIKDFVDIAVENAPEAKADQKQTGAAFMQQLVNGNKASGVEGVGAAPQIDQEQAERQSAIDYMTKKLNA